MCYVMSYPWFALLSLFVSCFWTTTEEGKSPGRKFLHYLVYAPILGLIEIFTFPLAVFGYVLWVLICNLFTIPDYAILSCPEEPSSKTKEENKNRYTFVSANLLLGIESLGKFQNMPFVYSRLVKIADSFQTISSQSEPICNKPILEDPKITDEELMDTSVMPQWPHVDFMCFQEVWDRFFTYKLVQSLYPEFKHFVVDVAHHSWKSNNYFGTSGLMIASRYPIMEVKFHVCRHKRYNTWQQPICYGVIIAKVDLGHKKVGFIANLHNVAYQAEDDLIGPFMTEVQSEFNLFRQEYFEAGQTEAFAVICGDFNFDNLSPGDSSLQCHPIFHQYSDYCMERPGVDKSWTVGTEHRQLNIYETELSSPKAMKTMMVDHVKRRFFIIDADIKEQTLDLMYCQPKADDDGEVRSKIFGGRRRIDRILVDTKSCKSEVEGYQFLTCLAGQSDHVPVALTLKCPY